jgi:hypothetical protein
MGLRFFRPFQTGPDGHPGTMDTGSFPQGKNGLILALAAHLPLTTGCVWTERYLFHPSVFAWYVEGHYTFFSIVVCVCVCVCVCVPLLCETIAYELMERTAEMLVM